MSTLNNLAIKIAKAMPEFESSDQRIAVGLYRLLAQGEPVSPRRIAETLHLPENVVQKRLARWPGVFYDDTRSVVGFWGLALSKMPHRLQVDGRTLYTWCAWDSLFIPEILGKTARFESTDPVTKERVSLVVGPEGVEELEPACAVVSFLTPNRAFDSDVIQSFCHFVHFFGSQKSGEAWSSRHEGTLLFSVDQAYKLGQMTNAHKLGEALVKTS